MEILNLILSRKCNSWNEIYTELPVFKGGVYNWTILMRGPMGKNQRCPNNVYYSCWVLSPCVPASPAVQHVEVCVKSLSAGGPSSLALGMKFDICQSPLRKATSLCSLTSLIFHCEYGRWQGRRIDPDKSPCGLCSRGTRLLKLQEVCFPRWAAGGTGQEEPLGFWGCSSWE